MHVTRWWPVHPAFGGVGPGEYMDVPSVTASMTADWAESIDEPSQDFALRECWLAVARWAGRVGADSIVIHDILDQPALVVESLGFTRRRGWKRSWSWAGTSSQIVDVLIQLWEVPTVNLTVSAGRYEIVEVRDHSWESVFIALPPRQEALPVIVLPER